MGKFTFRMMAIAAGAFLVLGLTLGAGVTPVQAKTVKLTFGGMWPPSHPITKANMEWIKKIEKESNGQVQIKAFWAGALYKARESALELGKGVADIGDLSGAYAPMGFDFEKSMRMVFYGLNDRKVARRVYYAAREKFPELDKEFTDAGLKVMAYASVPPYQLQLAKKKVSSVADLKGLTLKASGDLGKLANQLGAQGVVISMGETYTALQKTTIDGGFMPFETLKSFRFAEVVKYAVEVNVAAAPAGHWAFNLKSWNKLPKDIQKVFEDNIEWFGNRIEELMYAGEGVGIDLAKKNGVEFIKLPPEELAKVYAACDATAREKMKKLDEKGLPGTAVYEYMRSLVDQYTK